MKRRKWYLFGIVMMVYAVLRLIGTFIACDQSLKKLNIEVLEKYESISIFLEVIIVFVTFLGTLVMFRAVLGDLKKKPETVKIDYHFFYYILFVAVMSFVDIASTLKWETDYLPLQQDIARITGGEFILGHGTGLMTVLVGGVGFIHVLVVAIYAAILQRIYDKKKKKVSSME